MKTFLTPVVAIGCLLLSLTLHASLFGQDLRWSLEQGSKYQLQMKQHTDSVVTLSSKKLSSTVDLLVNVGWDVQSAEGEIFVVEQMIDSIRIEMKGPDDNPVVYDSREKKALVGAAKDLAGALSSLLGVKFKFTMNARGVISAAERMTPERADLVPGGEAGKATMLSKVAVEQMLRQPLLPLPQEPLTGDEPSWTDERQTKGALGDVTLQRTFTIAGNEERDGQPAVKIAVKGELEVAAPGVKGAPMLKEQNHSGNVWFTKEPGRMLATETSQRLVTESMYRDSTITVDLTTTLNTTLSPR